MQFVANGPDIPNALLEAHEEGRAVFFCGAGISYPAGLPGFGGLVDDLYNQIGTARTSIEEEAYSRGQYDATLDLLERRVPGQRLAVRKKLPDVLKPNWRRKGATDTHVALLELARCRDGAIRLVTTNFDRIFERVRKRPGKAFQSYAAPMLPIPKNSRWNGLVYLHGLLPEKPDDNALHRLVLTSGDFGLAYLTERWAARFVSELFRNYVVCFVGYSINDPVLRYMMDALAADRMQGEITPQAYALGDYRPGHERTKTIEWEAKGVTPILYEVPVGGHDHSALHKTLRAWAETHRDGTLGKERIVVDYARARPSVSTRQDDFVGRMLWAVSHQSGLPAKRFAEFNPVPALDWLEAFSTARYRHADLSQFGVPPREKVDDKLRFSLIRRPAPYSHAPWMTLAMHGVEDGGWDDVMFQLARWLVRHLNDPALIIWVAERGGRLHQRWLFLIEQELDRFARLRQEGSSTELDEIQAHAPNAVAGPLMQVLWRILLTGRVKSGRPELDLYRWKVRLKRDGLTASLRFELRELLSPKITLRKPFKWGSEDTDHPVRIKQLVDWELVLAADHIHATVNEFKDETWRAALPILLDDFQQLLRDALDLLRELGAANERNDNSHWDLPSISPHWQNRAFRDWVMLIELLRDAWLRVRENNPRRAQQIASAWFDGSYATFKRLAFFAAGLDSSVDEAKWIEWLLSDERWWLWVVDTRREVMRLLVLQGAKISPIGLTRLEAAIISGPPRSMYRVDLEPERWKSIVEQSVWLLLAKLHSGGAQMGATASNQLRVLSANNPSWHLKQDESDEFSHWMSGTGDPEYEGRHRVEIAPRNRQQLVKWLAKPRDGHQQFDDGDNWRELCRTRFFHSCFSLCDLAQEQVWPVERWREALQVWSEPNLVLRSWRYAAPLVNTMPETLIHDTARNVARWMEVASKVINRHEDILFNLCRRILELPDEPSENVSERGEARKDLVTDAFNHPVGDVAQALLNLWFRKQPNDNDLLPADIASFFTLMCSVRTERFRHGRVFLASRLIALFRVDRIWTEKHLLPYFDWESSSVEARAVWEGFLWSPRLYRPLLIAFKVQFLSTAYHYADLASHGGQFAAFLTYAALDPVEGYSSADFRSAIGALPPDGLQEVARTLSQALGGAGDQREDYWKNRVQPFWQQIWPKSRDLASKGISESLALLSIAAGGEFPVALASVVDWLQPSEHPHYIVHRLYESQLSSQFPEAALRLLNIVLADQPWAPLELRQCLNAISAAAPPLTMDPRYQRLMDYSRRRGA